VSAHAATAEHQITARAPAPVPAPPLTPTATSRPRWIFVGTVVVAAVLCFATFVAGGGLLLGPMTTVEILFTLLSGAVVVGVLLLATTGTRTYGLWSLGLLLAFTVLTGLSVVWSVAPDASWQDAGRMFAYSGVFAAALALVRIVPEGWRALLGGIVLAAVVACVYALLTKVFPDQVNETARLQEPYGYWNAIGLTAAMGAIGCMWLGARRAGHALLSALAYPALGLMVVTLLLAYSRGALVALAVGVLAWLCFMPLRLRGARVLIVAALGAAPVVAWDFSRHALDSENIALAARTTAGHQLGVLLVAMLVVLALVGTAIGFFGDRRAPSATARRNVGIALVALVVLAVIALAGGLAASRRGLTGTISHDLSSLTNPNAPVPTNTPGRLTSIGSVRARYWKEALEVFEAHPALGAGAAGYETARLRYSTAPLNVKHAHGYIVQTLADLGIVGLAITLALLVAWMVATGRVTHPFNRRWRIRRSPFSIAWRHTPVAYTPERIGMLAMLCMVIVFGVHSFADWTWYVPGDACVALLCAGWLAGRGPLPAGNLAAPAGTLAANLPAAVSDNRQATQTHPAGDPGASAWRIPTAAQLGPVRIGLVVAVIAGALLASWTEWQPQRSADASEQAEVLLPRDPVAARAAAEAGVERDPLSAVALFRLAAVEHATGESALARATLQKAVQMQPSNPETWLTLGEYDLSADPSAAVNELRAAVYLDPESVPAQNAYVRALQATGTAAKAAAASGTGTTAGKAGNGAFARRRLAQKRRRLALASRTR
jgi:O-antigen ligase/Tfp pilus assembly protein PilF